MNNNYSNALTRFKTYFSFAHNSRNDYDVYGGSYYTIKSMAAFLDIPLSVLRKDMLLLRKVTNPSFIFEPDMLYDEDILSSIAEKLPGACFISKDPDDVLEGVEKWFDSFDDIDEMIVKGVLDDMPFSITDNNRRSDNLMRELIEVPVSIDEYLVYNNLFEQESLPKRASNELSYITSVLRNKKYICEFKPEVLEILNALESEIKNNGCVKFDYYPTGQQWIQNVCIKPLKIGFDSTENRYVVISSENNSVSVYDLEYISNIRHAKDNGCEPLPDLFKYADKVWGFEYDKCFNRKGTLRKPLRVKVLFQNEGNVIEKVKRDLKYRNPVNLNTDDQGNLIYVDDVYGQDSFLSWVCSYGSSAIVLSPKSLIQDILKRLDADF